MNLTDITNEYTQLCTKLGELEARYRLDKNALLNRIVQLNDEAIKIQQNEQTEPLATEETK